MVVVEDSEARNKPVKLLEAIKKLNKDKNRCAELAKNLHAFVKENAAENLARIILSVAKEK